MVLLRLVCVALFAATVWCGGGAFGAAQDGAGKPQECRSRDYSDTKYSLTQYEVERFSEMLDLSPEQHETMMAIYAEVRRQVFEAEIPLRKSRDDFVEFSMTWFEGPREQVEANRARLREWMEELRTQEAEFSAFQAQVVETFFEDLELVLMPAQADRLDDVIRWRHRHRLLRWGMIPYSDFSVASVARSMDLRVDPSRAEQSAVPALEEVYAEYEKELDRMLMNRVAAERRFAPGARGMGEGESGTRVIESEADQEKWRVAVGEANLRLVNMQKKYIRRIANLLEPEDAAEFQQRCYEKGYWPVLDDSETDRRFAEFIEHPLLTEEQRARVGALQDEYAAAIAPINKEWIRAIDDYLNKGGARIAGAEVPVAIGDPRNRSDRLFDFSRSQMELRDQYRKRIAELRVEFGLDEPESSDP